MPIRLLSSLNSAKKITPISVLKDSSIAIDGFWYIRKYIPVLNKEFILDPTQFLNDFLQPLIELSKNTQIIFIWDGLKYRVGLSTTKEEMCFKIVQAIGSPVKIYEEEFLVEPVTEILRRVANISVIRAPHSAIAQCIYLHKKNAVNYIFTKHDALIFDHCSSLIVELDLIEKRLSILEKDVVETQFADSLLSKNSDFPFSGWKNSFKYMAIASGCEFCPTVPSFATNFDPEVFLTSFSNPAQFDHELLKDPTYFEQYNNALLSIRFHPIMSLNGDVENIVILDDPEEEIPCDLDKVFGPRLPSILYQLLFKCKISPLALNDYLQSKNEFIRKVQDSIDSILDNGINSKQILLSEFIKETLKIRLNQQTKINKLVTILFTEFMQNKILDQNSLIDFLNSGVEIILDPGKSIFDAIKEPIPSKPLSATEILTFLIANEAVIALRDLCEVSLHFKKFKDDMEFVLTVQKLLKSLNLAVGHDFFNYNLHFHGEFAAFLE